MNPSGESARINGADIHAAGQAACVPNGCGECGGSASVTCPMLKERWTREDERCTCPFCGNPAKSVHYDGESGPPACCGEVVATQMASDAKTAAILNAETIVGMQDALRKSEEREADLRRTLRDLLAEIEDAEGNTDGEYLVPPSPDCRDCTADTSPKNITCARHRAHYLVHGVRP